jgi:hypothetical protein
MTEADWLTGNDPITMIEFLRRSSDGPDRVSWIHNSSQWYEPQRGHNRRFRLFACECCRRIWNRIPEPVNHAAVMAVEELLEGRISPEEAIAAFEASSAVEGTPDGSRRRSEPGYWVVKYLGRGFYKMTAGASALIIAMDEICMMSTEYGKKAKDTFDVCYYTGDGIFLSPFLWPLPIPQTIKTELSFQTALLHCIFGNPFRPVAFSGDWRTETALILAQQMYESCDFEAMPILADALQDAGCENDDILTHCRGESRHVRGCWVIDQILGKQ